VPSRLLHFPDENHWVLKPQNSRLWYREVLSWMDRYTRRKPAAGNAPPAPARVSSRPADRPR
jgi:Prolyl oligopeptidase family